MLNLGMHRASGVGLATVGAACLVVGAGCGGSGPSSKPLSTSLGGLVTESEPVSGPILSHMGITTIAGLAPFPGTGLMYHFPRVGWLQNKALSAQMAVGIAQKNSFEMIGTVRADEGAVHSVAATMASVQEAIERGASAIVRKAGLSARKAALTTNLEKEFADANAEAGKRRDALAAFLKDKPNATADERKGLDDLAEKAKQRVDSAKSALNRDADQQKITNTELGDIVAALKQAEADIRVADEDLATRQECLRTLMSRNPGVLVIRWKTNEKETIGGSAGPIIKGSSERNDTREGYAVLGSIRVREIFFGEDLKRMWLRLSPEDRAAAGAASISSYAVQAKQVYYVAEGKFLRTITANLDAKLKDLTSTERLLANIDRVKLDYYLNTMANLGNTGSIKDMEWDMRSMSFDKPEQEYPNLLKLMRQSKLDKKQSDGITRAQVDWADAGTYLSIVGDESTSEDKRVQFKVMPRNTESAYKVPPEGNPSPADGEINPPAAPPNLPNTSPQSDIDRANAVELLKSGTITPEQLSDDMSGVGNWTTVQVTLTQIGKVGKLWDWHWNSRPTEQLPYFSPTMETMLSRLGYTGNVQERDELVTNLNAVLASDPSYKMSATLLQELRRLIAARERFGRELYRVSLTPQGRTYSGSQEEKDKAEELTQLAATDWFEAINTLLLRTERTLGEFGRTTWNPAAIMQNQADYLPPLMNATRSMNNASDALHALRPVKIKKSDGE